MTSIFDTTHEVNYTRLIFYPLLLVTSVLWILHRWQQKSRLYQLGQILPGPQTVPFFGNALLAFGKRPDRKLYNLNSVMF